MLFQRINRNNPEKVFIVVINSSATALTNGQAVQWDFTDSTVHGVGVCAPTARATNAGFATAGIAAEGIAVGAHGLIQVYGYHSATRVRAMTGNVAVAAGTNLAINSAGTAYCLEKYATGTAIIQVFPCAFSLGANATFATTKAIAVFIKAL